MPTITSRPTARSVNLGGTQANLYISHHQIGDIVTFEPFKYADQGNSYFGMSAKVMRVSFETGKVLYDLALQEDLFAQHYNEDYPIRSVDSFLVAVHP